MQRGRLVGETEAAILAVELSKEFTVRGVLPGRPKARIHALSDVNLEVLPRTVHGLIGPNGSGKSTLLRVLATLVLPSSGEAYVRGADVRRAPLAVRRSIGLSTGDERSLYWRLTGRQNLEFYAALYRLNRVNRPIDDALQLVGLFDVADRPVATYSQGMMRRLGLARAILHEPPVLLLDEPARSLDPQARERLYALIHQLTVERGCAVLLATHDLDEAKTVCDRVSVLQAGHVVRELARGDFATLRDALVNPC